MSVITLTTDFGTADWFVGTMKGVIAGINPRATVIDITHDIPPQNVGAAAFALAMAYRFFPERTVHVVVVDPGVGSTRRAIAVRTARYFFVGPDNGVLSLALAREKIQSVHLLENKAYFLKPVSRTFHGRDIFAPVAAHLSRGLPITKLGPELDKFVQLPHVAAVRDRGKVTGRIMYIDRFGNAITNVAETDLGAGELGRAQVILGPNLKCEIANCYSAVAPGRLVAVFGSTGYLEVAVNCGNAAEQFGLRVGQKVSVRIRRD
ncbi:MAG: SAM-dependent chlorinase/fluorinase [Verrucomicrobiae bacterium]|nr:SAM-dependent chlorinase/fluorinase [Verrucomicrobiae bacterium]